MTTLSRRSFVGCGISLSAAVLAGLKIASGETASARMPFDMPGYREPTFPDRQFVISDYGARPDGTTKNTQAMAAAIAACAQAGGGRVVVPEGTWLTGPIHLQSNVNLHLAEGAVVRFSRVFDDYLPVVRAQRAGVRCYNYSTLIYARNCTNIAVTGSGTLDGQGEVWWPWKKKSQGMARLFESAAKGIPVEQRIFGTEADGVRPSFIQPIDCRNVLLEGITVKDGPSWNIHPAWCENLTVRRVTVTALGPNNDGIDPEGCRNVVIEDCVLDTGDDSICLKAGRNEDGWAVGRPCENIVIRRCTTKRGHGGVVFGSEMSAGIRNVLVHDCRFDGTDRGIRIKSCPGRGGFIENVWVQDVAMDRIPGSAINITLLYPGSQGDTTAAMPKFRNFHMRNITCAKAKLGVEITGLPECVIEDVTLENLKIESRDGLRAKNVRNLRLKNVQLSSQTTPVMEIVDGQDVTIEQASCPEGTKVYLQLAGSRSKNVRLKGVDLSKAERGVVTADEVPAGALLIEPRG